MRWIGLTSAVLAAIWLVLDKATALPATSADLLRIMNSFLEDALGVLVADVILEGPATPEHVVKVLATEFERVSIPFWAAMPSRRT